MHIAIAGNIGSGKTTLTRMLAHHYGWTPRFEPVDNNPYLADFYADMARWSFNLQIYFLNKRFKEVVEISRSKEVVIQDRTIFEDARIFAPNLHAQGMMSDRDFDNYCDLFDLMMSLVNLPRTGFPPIKVRSSSSTATTVNSVRIQRISSMWWTLSTPSFSACSLWNERWRYPLG